MMTRKNVSRIKPSHDHASAVDRRRHDWWSAAGGLLIILAGVAAYHNSLDGVHLFDEDRRIVNNEQIRRLWPPWDLLATRRPVVSLSLAVNYAIGGDDVTGYHVFNVGVHILAALTLYGVVRLSVVNWRSPIAERRTPTGGIPNRPHAGQSTIDDPQSPVFDVGLALAAALIWVVHPLGTQSVTYIIQRSEALMGLFFLLTLYCVIRGARSSRGVVWYAVAVGCCILGMGSKAVMVTAPVMVLLYDRTFLAGSFAGALRRRFGLYLILGATWFVLGACGVVWGVLHPSPRIGAHVGFAFTGVTPKEYLLSQAGVIAYYLRLSLWPHPLCLDYYWPVARSLGAVLGPMLLVVLLLAAALWALVRKPWLGFLGAWFFVILAPTSSFIPIKDLAFEHRMYLPLAGVIVLVVVAGHALLTAVFSRTGSRSASDGARRAVATVLVVAAVASLGWATVRRNTYYASAFEMWSDVVAKRPNNPRAHDSLGIAWEALGRLDEAEREYREAIRIDPGYVNAYNNLGSVLSKRGSLDEAIAQYRAALRVAPRHLVARINLGDALVRRGILDEGTRMLRGVVRNNPTHPVALYALGNALSARGDLDEAIEKYRRALEAKPDFAKVHYSLGNALRDKGLLEEAVEEYRQAARLEPNLAPVHNNLGFALLRLGRAEEASNAFREALRADPLHTGARYGLGLSLTELGRFDDAINELNETLRIQPEHPMAQRALQQALDAKTRLRGE